MTILSAVKGYWGASGAQWTIVKHNDSENFPPNGIIFKNKKYYSL